MFFSSNNFQIFGRQILIYTFPMSTVFFIRARIFTSIHSNANKSVSLIMTCSFDFVSVNRNEKSLFMFHPLETYRNKRHE